METDNGHPDHEARFENFSCQPLRNFQRASSIYPPRPPYFDALRSKYKDKVTLVLLLSHDHGLKCCKDVTEKEK
jgi:hypothetical protein